MRLYKCIMYPYVLLVWGKGEIEFSTNSTCFYEPKYMFLESEGELWTKPQNWSSACSLIFRNDNIVLLNET